MAVLAAYLLAFSAAALVCFGALWPVRRINDADTRRGLGGLLVLSGLWAAATVARFLAGGVQTKELFHLFGLVVGLGAVGAWLYFCSAYAGRDYHRRPDFAISHSACSSSSSQSSSPTRFTVSTSPPDSRRHRFHIWPS